MLLTLTDQNDGISRSVTTEHGTYQLSSKKVIIGIGLTLSKHTKATASFREETVVLTHLEATKLARNLLEVLAFHTS